MRVPIKVAMVICSLGLVLRCAINLHFYLVILGQFITGVTFPILYVIQVKFCEDWYTASEVPSFKITYNLEKAVAGSGCPWRAYRRHSLFYNTRPICTFNQRNRSPKWKPKNICSRKGEKLPYSWSCNGGHPLHLYLATIQRASLCP